MQAYRQAFGVQIEADDAVWPGDRIAKPIKACAIGPSLRKSGIIFIISFILLSPLNTAIIGLKIYPDQFNAKNGDIWQLKECLQFSFLNYVFVMSKNIVQLLACGSQ